MKAKRYRGIRAAIFDIGVDTPPNTARANRQRADAPPLKALFPLESLRLTTTKRRVSLCATPQFGVYF